MELWVNTVTARGSLIKYPSTKYRGVVQSYYRLINTCTEHPSSKGLSSNLHQPYRSSFTNISILSMFIADVCNFTRINKTSLWPHSFLISLDRDTAEGMSTLKSSTDISCRLEIKSLLGWILIFFRCCAYAKSINRVQGQHFAILTSPYGQQLGALVLFTISLYDWTFMDGQTLYKVAFLEIFLFNF